MKYLNRIICSALILGGLPIAAAIDGASKTGKAHAIQGQQSPSISPEDQEKIEHLIVMIKCKLDGEDSFGAGIMFGLTSDRLYIATANHVVRKGDKEAQALRVEFKWRPGQSVEARLLERVEGDLDLAVLAVEDVTRLLTTLRNLPFDQLGDPGSLKREDSVHLLGSPRGRPPDINVTPGKVSSKSSNSIFFESAVIEPGHSGGALLNERMEIIGMIRASEPPRGEAINIQSVVDALRQWGFPLSLRRNHLNTIKGLINTAETYRKQRQYDQAEPLLKRALEITEEALGKDHPDTAQLLNYLASFYYEQNWDAKAESLFKRALEINEKVFGREHLTTVYSLDNLGILYRTQGRYAEAEPIIKRLLAIYKREHGGEHPITVQCQTDLARVYQEQGRYAEAEPLFKSALEINEKKYGREDSNIGSSLLFLATLYLVQGRYAEAEPLIKRSIPIYERLGKEHSQTVIKCQTNLARVYQEQGRYAEAEPLFKRALEIAENTYGAENISVAPILENYASLLLTMSRENEAATLAARAREIRARSK